MHHPHEFPRQIRILWGAARLAEVRAPPPADNKRRDVVFWSRGWTYSEAAVKRSLRLEWGLGGESSATAKRLL